MNKENESWVEKHFVKAFVLGMFGILIGGILLPAIFVFLPLQEQLIECRQDLNFELKKPNTKSIEEIYVLGNEIEKERKETVK